MADQLNDDDVAAIKQCHYRTQVWGGITYVDSQQCTDEQTIDLFRIASGTQVIGIRRVRSMIEHYKHAANYADLDRPPVKVEIFIKQPPQGELKWKPLTKPKHVPAEPSSLIATATPASFEEDNYTTLQPPMTDGAEWVDAILGEMMTLGLEIAANYIRQGLATPRTEWISSNAFYANKETDMWVVSDQADDWAELYHNDEILGKVWPGQELRQVVTDYKPGVNFLIAKVDNNSVPPGMMSLRTRFAQGGEWVPSSAYKWTQDGQLLGGRTWYIVTRYIAR